MPLRRWAYIAYTPLTDVLDDVVAVDVLHGELRRQHRIGGRKDPGRVGFLGVERRHHGAVGDRVDLRAVVDVALVLGPVTATYISPLSLTCFQSMAKRWLLPSFPLSEFERRAVRANRCRSSR